MILYKSIYLNRIKNYTESQKLIQKNNLEVKLAKNILKNKGNLDLIYSANTISHIPNLKEVFKAVFCNATYPNEFLFKNASKKFDLLLPIPFAPG